MARRTNSSFDRTSVKHGILVKKRRSCDGRKFRIIAITIPISVVIKTIIVSTTIVKFIIFEHATAIESIEQLAASTSSSSSSSRCKCNGEH